MTVKQTAINHRIGVVKNFIHQPPEGSVSSHVNWMESPFETLIGAKSERSNMVPAEEAVKIPCSVIASVLVNGIVATLR
jgi:hypothetical protein